MYDPFDNMTFSNNNCFLCGCKLSKDNRTDEHVYPKWLQKKFKLWDRELSLLNNTLIKYKNLKIPCCKSCNEKMSGLLEKPIERAVSSGYEQFILLDKKIIFLWLNKLSYGILFKELSLKLKRENPNRGSIYSEEDIKEKRMQYTFLQTIISDTKYIGTPYSILIFKIDPCNEEEYWAHDNPNFKTFFIRMNDIGIIANLMDNGFNENFFLGIPDMEKFTHYILHPIQFLELCARFLYKCSLFFKDPFYIISSNETDNKANTIISQSLSGIAYNKWNQKNYAEVLSFYLKPYKLSFSDIYENGVVASWLQNSDGSFNNIVKNYHSKNDN